jgi:hypothetical protein
MFLLSRPTDRGDLRSAGISRLFARPLRFTGPHHSRRGHSPASFYIGRGTRVLPLRFIPQELLARRSPGALLAVEWLDAVLDPGAVSALVSSHGSLWPAPTLTGSALSPSLLFSGLCVGFRATPFTSPLSLLFLLLCRFSHFTTGRLTIPYPERLPRLLALPPRHATLARLPSISAFSPTAPSPSAAIPASSSSPAPPPQFCHLEPTTYRASFVA